MSDQDPRDNPWRAAGLVGVIGIDLAVCLGAGIWLGRLAGEYWGGSKLTVVAGILIGLAAGITGAVLLIKKFTGGSHG